MNFDLYFWFLYRVGLLCIDRKFCQNGHYKGHIVYQQSAACCEKCLPLWSAIQMPLVWTGTPWIPKDRLPA
jgi:hypothetical protein